jgi:hypothetical protein
MKAIPFPLSPDTEKKPQADLMKKSSMRFLKLGNIRKTFLKEKKMSSD